MLLNLSWIRSPYSSLPKSIHSPGYLSSLKTTKTIIVSQKIALPHLTFIHSLLFVHPCKHFIQPFQKTVLYDALADYSHTLCHRLIAKEMVQLHRVKSQDCNPSSNGRGMAFSLAQKFLDLRFSPDAPPGKGLDGYDGPGEDTLRKELRALEDHLSKVGSPLVYCHNDLLLNNVIYNQEKNSVHFIDYEYTGMNYQAFDIGNHFCEFAGVDEVDYSLYPDRELQFAWLRQYLKYWKEGTRNKVTDHDVEKLYVQVNKFALAANFMWGTWALVQAKYSSIDFDYLKYAKERLGEYFRRKDEFLGLQMPELVCSDNNAA